MKKYFLLEMNFNDKLPVLTSEVLAIAQKDLFSRVFSLLDPHFEGRIEKDIFADVEVLDNVSVQSISGNFKLK